MIKIVYNINHYPQEYCLEANFLAFKLKDFLAEKKNMQENVKNSEGRIF